MKKFFNYFTMLFMAMALCASFAACSDDDEDDGNSLVNQWFWEQKNDQEREYILVIFEADGTCEYNYEYYLRGLPDAKENVDFTATGTWSVDGDQLVINLTHEDGNKETITFTIISLKDYVLTLETKDGERKVFTGSKPTK